MLDLESLKLRLKDNMHRINSRSVSLRNAKEHCMYLTICNAMGMSLVYGLDQEIPKKYLPPSRTPQSTSLAELGKQRSRWDAMLRSIETVLVAFESDLKRKEPIVNDLGGFQVQVKTARSWTVAKLVKRPRLEVSTIARAYGSYLRPEIRQCLEDLEQDLVYRVEGLDDRLEGLREMEEHHLDELSKDIGNAIKEMKKLIKSNISECKEWGTYLHICKTTIKAIKKTTYVFQHYFTTRSVLYRFQGVDFG